MAQIRLLNDAEKQRLTRAMHLLSVTHIDGFSGLPYLAPAFGKLRVFVDEECPTAYTDGNFRVGINADFLDSQKTPLAQLAFVLAHEGLHCILRHNIRQTRSGYDPNFFNIIGDLEINSQLISGCLGADCAGPVTCGEGAANGHWEYILGGVTETSEGAQVSCLVPAKTPFEELEPGLSAEAYGKTLAGRPPEDLAKLTQEMSGADMRGSQKKRQTKGLDEAAGLKSAQEEFQKSCQQDPLTPTDIKRDTDPEFQAADALGIEALSASQREVVEAACRAAAQDFSRNPGNASRLKTLSFIFDCLVPSCRPWKEIFEDRVAEGLGEAVAGRADYSFVRPARRRQSSGFIYPGFLSHAPKIACVLDTSGSMEKEDFTKAASEIMGVLEVVGEVQVALCDADCSGVFSASDIAEVLERLQGGGGTYLSPAIDSLERDGEPFDLGVVVTDGWLCHEEFAERLAEDGHQWILGLTCPGRSIDVIQELYDRYAPSQMEVVACYNN